MNLKELIKEVERLIVEMRVRKKWIVEDDECEHTLLGIKQTVEAVDKIGVINPKNILNDLSPEDFEDWEKLKKQLGLR